MSLYKVHSPVISEFLIRYRVILAQQVRERAGPGEGVSLGAPYFGGAGGPCSPLDTDGTYNLGGTLAHEIGHYLGLPHIWGDVNGGGCGGDDGFADTPNQASQYFGCPNSCVAFYELYQ